MSITRILGRSLSLFAVTLLVFGGLSISSEASAASYHLRGRTAKAFSRKVSPPARRCLIKKQRMAKPAVQAEAPVAPKAEK